MRSGPKKGAFENSNTGYGKHRFNSNPAKHHSANCKASSGKSEPEKSKKVDEKPKVPQVDEIDGDLNSGFGAYLRSGEGVEMMKLFIFANTIMLIFTMGWPHFQEQYYWLMEWWYSYGTEQ